MSDRPGTDYNGMAPPFTKRDGADVPVAPLDRLPPPMFPPGARRRPAARVVNTPPVVDESIPEDAFLRPDDPIRRPESAVQVEAAPEGESPREATMSFDSALIDLDAPIVRTEEPRKPDDYEEVVLGTLLQSAEQGEVTGIGDRVFVQDEELPLLAVAAGDPEVALMIRSVKHLADALAQKGEAGLRTSPEMTRFEVTLRAYCTGYLSGLREERREG